MEFNFELLNKLKNEIIDLRKQIIEELSPIEQHFNIGDSAYIANVYNLVDEVKITHIQNFSKIHNREGGYIYYFYEDKDVNYFNRFQLHLNYYIWLIKAKFFNKNKPYMIHKKFGPGHGELAGLGNVLFKTKQQAKFDYIFDNLISSIEDFEQDQDILDLVNKEI